MGVWVCIVEGDGEAGIPKRQEGAIPLLLRRLVHGKFKRYTVTFKAYNAHGHGNLTDPKRFQYFIDRALMERDLEAIVVVLDAENDCPKRLALKLANWVRQRNPHVPVAIVVANRCYEAWLLAGHCWDRQPEVKAPGTVKKEITQKIGQASYRETRDQPYLTAQMKIWKAYRRCRSFRRLINAVRQIIDAIDNQRTVVTP